MGIIQQSEKRKRKGAQVYYVQFVHATQILYKQSFPILFIWKRTKRTFMKKIYDQVLRRDYVQLLFILKIRAGNLLISFLSESLLFCKQISEWAIRLKKQAMRSFAHFGERPERFAHGRSFLGSDLSESLMVAHFWWANWAIPSHHSPKIREWAYRSFFK